MAIELRHSARTVERSEPSDPLQTGPRARLTELGSHADDNAPTTSVIERPSERPGSERHSGTPARRSRVTRPSMRPSAFGMPRSSAPPGSEVNDASVFGALGSRAEDPRASTTRGSTPPGRPAAKRESLPPHAGAAPPRAGSARTHASPPGRADSAPFERSPTEEPGDSPGISQTVRVRARVTAPPPAVRTDIEELLPISQGVKSLPRPPRMPSFEPSLQATPAPRRFPWASLVVFGVVLAASLAPLFHYRGERKQVEPVAPQRETSVRAAETSNVQMAAPTASPASAFSLARGQGARFERALAGQPPASTPASTMANAVPSAVERIERAFWGEPARVHQALLEEGERALHADDERLAETLFARARDFDGDDAQGAFGLARVRLAQGDLEGAEGWVLLAIRKRPRRAEYRALHAEILQRFGRGPEAQLERALAR